MSVPSGLTCSTVILCELKSSPHTDPPLTETMSASMIGDDTLDLSWSDLERVGVGGGG